MPKIGASKEEASRPYVLRCKSCGCTGLNKLISRFNIYGKAAATVYRCRNPYHNCGDELHEGCYPKRVYTDEPARSDVAIERDLSFSEAEGVWGPTVNPDGSYGGNPDHEHRFIYADDGMGHEGDICDCGAFRY